MKFFNAADLGFYDTTINDSIPEGGVEISAEHYLELMVGQSAGMVIAADESGCPVLVNRPPPSPEVLAAAERAWRDWKLTSADPLVSRHRDELEEGGPTSLTGEQYAELQAYRRALRNWPEAGEFPFAEHRPPAPSWLSEVIA
ncbi:MULTISPECIES: phage tail assembly chaperone [Pseudomonas]|uniref:phage tail assembly chaperone n=1 Tax=Pseudomonas TaxID=286 RepID=UPI001071418A|nr:MULTISPECIES: phage tail assembly chaperone [Pseudomonas]QBR32943.1 phage tail protein [Pseudomonas sp. S150]UZT91128.1 phage tail assembly chaperone [Pseudomonas koreensis]